jgi:hypothetical protein
LVVAEEMTQTRLPQHVTVVLVVAEYLTVQVLETEPLVKETLAELVHNGQQAEVEEQAVLEVTADLVETLTAETQAQVMVVQELQTL